MFCRKDNFHIYSYLYSNSDFWKSIFFYFCTFPDLSLRIKSEKLPESYKFKYPNNEKFLFAAIYNREKRFRIMSAPVRIEGLFWRPHGCNIVTGTDPPSEAVTEDFQNFGQRFSAADFCCRQTTASCTFVCRKVFRHTKGARSARPGRSPESNAFLTDIMDNNRKLTDKTDKKL